MGYSYDAGASLADDSSSPSDDMDIPYRRMSLSTRPSVSTILCSPVQNGWQLLHTSTLISGFVPPVMLSVPQAHITLASGW